MSQRRLDNAEERFERTAKEWSATRSMGRFGQGPFCLTKLTNLKCHISIATSALGLQNIYSLLNSTPKKEHLLLFSLSISSRSALSADTHKMNNTILIQAWQG